MDGGEGPPYSPNRAFGPGGMAMRTFKQLAWILAAVMIWNTALAGSSSVSTTVVNGEKVTTKIKTDGKGVTTTTVITKHKDGTESSTTTVTDKDGKIISTDDPGAQARADAAAKASQDKEQALANAPKRGPNDPIQVALFQPVVSEDLRKATTKEGVFPYIRKEFDKDPVIKLMDQNRVDGYVKDHDFKTGKSTQFSSFNRGPEFLAVDVYVETFATLEQKVGISKATKKLASAPFLVYRGVIYSEYSDKTWEVKAEGFILANPQVTKEFADKIKAVVKGEAGSIIPADPAKFRRGGNQVNVDGGQVKDAFKGLFKKKQ